jgi:hypothetical protein
MEYTGCVVSRWTPASPSFLVIENKTRKLRLDKGFMGLCPCYLRASMLKLGEVESLEQRFLNFIHGAENVG